MQLILTADQRFSLQDSNAIYLGRWALVDPTADAEKRLMPYPFDDRKALYVAYQRMHQLYLKWMPKLASMLNTIHGVNQSPRFWEILVGYWFKEYLEILYEKYICIKKAAELYPEAHVALIHHDNYYYTRSSAEFELLTREDAFNHQMYSYIIEHLNLFKIIFPVTPPERPLALSKKSNFKKKLLNSVKFLNLKCARKNDVFIITSYFPVKLLLELNTKFKAVPLMDSPLFNLQIENLNHHMRTYMKADMEHHNEFEALAWDGLQYFLPGHFVENFNKLQMIASKYYPRKSVKIIMTANSFSVNDVFKYWAGMQVEDNKVPYIILQHGGNYGCALWNSSEDYEIGVADYYLTYGWGKEKNNKVIPFLPSRIVKNKVSRLNRISNGHFLWALPSIQRYAYTMYSLPVGPQFYQYLLTQIQFYNALNLSAQKRILCKPYKISYGWNDIDFIAKNTGRFKVASAHVNIDSLIKKAALCVCPYNATFHLETLRYNIPTIMFWDPAAWEIRAEAKAYYDQLHEVGILYYSPIEAADKINQIQNHIDDWWYQSDLQKVRNEFCKQFVNQSDTTARDWMNLINGYIKHHES